MERGHAELPCLQPDVGQLGTRPGGSPQAGKRGEVGAGGIAIGKAQGIEGIIRREGLRGIQRSVRRILTGWIEDVVVALIFLGEARIG